MQIRRFFRPAERTERPQPRREPGIKNVRILLKFFGRCSALRTFFRIFAGNNHFAAILAVPDRNAVSPPQLTAYTPVADIFHPVRVRILPFFRIEHDFAVFPRLERLFCKRLHFYKPLIAQIRLYNGITAVTVTYRMSNFFLFLKKSEFLQIFYNQSACLRTRKTAIFFRTVFVQSAVRIKNIYDFKIIPLTNLPVVRVVSRRNFYHTGSEFLVYVTVCNNRNNAVCKRKFKFLAYNILVAFVSRIYGDSCITKKRLRTRSSNFNARASVRRRSVSKLIPDVVHCAGCISVINFVICKRSSATRTPVYKILTFIDKSALVKRNENFADCF